MSLYIYDVFYAKCSHQHTKAAITFMFGVMLILQNKKLQIWLVVSPSLHNKITISVKIMQVT
jgi:hypothetical protein